MSYDRQSRNSGRSNGPGQRSGLGYWLPIALTLTVATAGLAVWAWNERKEHDVEEEDEKRRRRDGRRKYDQAQDGVAGPSRGPGVPPGAFPDDSSSFQERIHTSETYSSNNQRDFVEMRDVEGGENDSIVARMSGALRRTPSPQQFFDGASKRVAAGVAAAGVMMGSALGAIHEEDKDDYVDHERWSEEADNQDREESRPLISSTGNVIGVQKGLPPAVASGRSRGGQNSMLGKGKQRMVVVVVSADVDDAHDQGSHGMYRSEHASILSHLTTSVNPDTTQLVILIYAPHLGAAGSNASTPTTHTPATTPGVELASIDPQPYMSKTSSREPALYTSLYHEALGLVGQDNPTSIIPFSTSNGHVHLLRHLGPSVVYLQESLSNIPGAKSGGEAVNQISGWVGQVVVIVGGDLGGGLVDTETEDEAGRESRGSAAKSSDSKWWQDEARVGLGKGVEVVEGLRVEEDWQKRINGGP